MIFFSLRPESREANDAAIKEIKCNSSDINILEKTYIRFNSLTKSVYLRYKEIKYVKDWANIVLMSQI